MADGADLESGSEIGSTVADARVVSAEQICTGLRSSPTPSVLMTHVMDLTVKIWPGCGRDEEPAEKTILFDKETAHTPLPGAPTVDGISSAVHRGVSRDGRLIGRGACNQEQEGNRHTSYTGSGRQYNVIPYSCGLLVCISYRMICRGFRGGPCPPYIVWRQGYKSVRSER